jgi:hypothetical protein
VEASDDLCYTGPIRWEKRFCFSDIELKKLPSAGPLPSLVQARSQGSHSFAGSDHHINPPQ